MKSGYKPTKILGSESGCRSASGLPIKLFANQRDGGSSNAPQVSSLKKHLFSSSPADIIEIPDRIARQMIKQGTLRLTGQDRFLNSKLGRKYLEMRGYN